MDYFQHIPKVNYKFGQLTSRNAFVDLTAYVQIIDEIKDKGGIIKSFKSYCGGLVAPDYDTNPWNYKFTWNPRNVVLAGQGTAQYIDSGKYKYIPYGQLFKRTDTVNVLNYGQFEAYANRDSLSYREVYKLYDIPTLFRGTLRKPGYCEAWDLFVQMGMTDAVSYTHLTLPTKRIV